MRHAPRPRRPRRGFSIIEVMVAIVLLGVALSSLGILAFGASRRSATTGAATFRAAIISEVADRYQALEWTDLIASQNYDSTITAGPMPHTRSVVITAPGTTLRTVRVIVTPTNTLIAPETTFVNRYRYQEVNPLNMATAP